MEHKHDVIDKDKLFKIDPVTRAILNNSSKTTVVQYDHNFERFTFELPRIVDGHDMSLCNKVEVHYFNIDDSTKKVNSGIYEVHDLKAEGETVTCSWLISGNSTQLKGLLKFLVRYKCVEDDVTTYAWNTLFFTGLYVSDGSDADQIFETEYVDVIEQWKASVMQTLRDEISAWEEAKAKELEGNLSAWKESEQAEIRRLFGDYETYWQRQIDVERARIDNFTKLAEGSTTGDAELQDIRIGANGKAYESAGSSVRDQFNEKFKVTTENKNYDWLTGHKKPVAENYVFYSDGTFGESQDCTMFCVPVEGNTRYRFTNANDSGETSKTAMQRLGFCTDPFISVNDPVDMVGQIIYHTEDAFTTPERCKYILFVVEKNHYVVTGAYETSIQKITDDYPEPTYPITDKRFNYELSEGISIPYLDDQISGALSRIDALEYIPECEVIAWGDSLTYGAGSGEPSKNSYTAVLSQMIGMDIVNYGVGGENIETILGRQGGLPMMVQPGFTIPTNLNPVEISLKSITGGEVKPLLQSAQAEKGINPCRIDGVSGTLSYNEEKYYFTRAEIGDSVTIDRPVMLFTKAMTERKNNQILLIWIGQNNAFEIDKTDTSTFGRKLISAIHACIKYANTDKYLILSSPIDGNIGQYDGIFEQIATEFGGNFVNVFEYLLEYGLLDTNIVATETDIENLSFGRIPQSLRFDGVHLNAAGYRSVAKCVYKRGKEYGYW